MDEIIYFTHNHYYSYKTLEYSSDLVENEHDICINGAGYIERDTVAWAWELTFARSRERELWKVEFSDGEKCGGG